MSLPTCDATGKIAYPSENSARRAIRDLKNRRRDGGGFLNAYRCGQHWHVGHGHKSRQTKPGRRFR